MSVASMLNQTVTVYRRIASSGSKKAYSKIGPLRIMIAPMSAIASQTSEITFGRGFTGYVLSSANVAIGDYIQDNAGIQYDVQGSRNYTMGSQPFIELTLQRQARQGQQ